MQEWIYKSVCVYAFLCLFVKILSSAYFSSSGYFINLNICVCVFFFLFLLNRKVNTFEFSVEFAFFSYFSCLLCCNPIRLIWSGLACLSLVLKRVTRRFFLVSVFIFPFLVLIVFSMFLFCFSTFSTLVDHRFGLCKSEKTEEKNSENVQVSGKLCNKFGRSKRKKNTFVYCTLYSNILSIVKKKVLLYTKYERNIICSCIHPSSIYLLCIQSFSFFWSFPTLASCVSSLSSYFSSCSDFCV